MIRLGRYELVASLLDIPGNEHLRSLIGKRAASGPRWKRAVETSARRELNTVLLVFKGLVLVSEANEREHYLAKDARRKWQQDLVVPALAQVTRPYGPWRVVILRRGPNKLDTDNLQGSGKHLRDAIARWCGVDDGDEQRFRCAVQQSRGPYVVNVTIEGSAW